LAPIASRAASIRPSEQKLAAIVQVVNLVFADSFTQADIALSNFNDTIPSQPFYQLLFASIIYARMMDGEDYSREKEFMRNIDSAINTFDKWIDRNPDDAWGYFFLASAYGYKAVWQGQRGSWFKSMLTGLKSKGRFADALKIDPRLFDCYTGIGSYHYWSSVKLRKIFPFLSDNRQEGLSELKLAMDSSYISSKAAAVGYGWALLNEKKYSAAIKVANSLKETTFAGRNSLWLLSAIYWANGNLRKAAENYRLLADALERAGNQNYYNLIYCRYRMGVCYYSLKNYPAAKDEFKALLAYNPSKEIRERHKKTYIRTREYLDLIQTAVEKTAER